MARRPPPPPGPARWLAHDLAAGARDLIVACVDLALPPTCAGCGWPGTTWCAICRATMAQDRFPRGAARVSPTPIPVGFPDAWAAVPYEGVVRTMLSAYKDDGRRDLAPVLAGLLLEPLAAAAAAAGGEVLVVPVPSSPAARRRRGDCPLAAVVRLATRPAGGTRCETGLLRVARRVADQAGLASGARAANLAGAFVAVPVDGRPVIVVDDVVTTGATLAEAARALREAGAGPVFAACVAATRRRPASAEMPT